MKIYIEISLQIREVIVENLVASHLVLNVHPPTIFLIEAPTLPQARAIGTNVARIVKRKPLKEINSEVMKP